MPGEAPNGTEAPATSGAGSPREEELAAEPRPEQSSTAPPPPRTAPRPGRRFLGLLLAVLAVGAVVRFLVAGSMWFDLDESQYLQGAELILRGGAPGLTYVGRGDSLVVYALAASMALGGPSLWVGRALMVLFSALTAATLGLIAFRISGRRKELAAVVAIVVFLLSPFAEYQNSIIFQPPLAGLLQALSFLFLIRPSWRPFRGNLALSGIFLGLAVLARRDSIILLAPWVLLVWSERATWRERWLPAVEIAVPAGLVVGAYVGYLAVHSSWTWALQQFGSGSLAYGQLVVPLGQRLSVGGFALVIAAPFFLVPALLGVRHLRDRGHPGWGWAFGTGSSVAVLAFLYFYETEAAWGVGEPVFAQLVPFVALTAAIWFVLLARELLDLADPLTVRGSTLLALAAWGFLPALVAELDRSQGFVQYIVDGLPGLALLFGCWFTTLHLRSAPSKTEPSEWSPPEAGPRFASSRLLKKRGHPGAALAFSLVAISLILLSSFLAAVWVLGPSNPNNLPEPSDLPAHDLAFRTYSPALVDQVSTYLAGVMRPDDTVFSFDDIFVVSAGRVNTPSISLALDPYIHLLESDSPSNVTPYPSAPAGIAPSLQGLLQDWNASQLTYFVEGYRASQVLAHCPLLNWYIETTFHPVQSFLDPYDETIIRVWERGAVPAPQVQVERTAAVPALGTKPGSSIVVACDTANQTCYYGSLYSSSVTVVYPNGSSGQIDLGLVDGVRALGFGLGYLWAGSSLTPTVEAYPVAGGNPLSFNVGSGPNGFAFDPTDHRVFVTTVSGSNLTALTTTPEGKWTTFWRTSVGANVSDVALDAPDDSLWVASTGTSSVVEINAGDGALQRTVHLPFPPYAVAYAQGTVVAAWWLGELYAINAHTGVVFGSLAAGPEVAKMSVDPTGQYLAVPSERDGSLTLLSPGPFVLLGTFHGFACPTDVAWEGAPWTLATSNTCQAAANETLLATPTAVTVQAAADAQLTVGTTSIPTGTTLELWPQVLDLHASSPSTLPGWVELTVEPGAPPVNVTVPLGPSFANLTAVADQYSEEVTGGILFAAVLAWGLILAGAPWVDPPRAPLSSDEPVFPDPEEPSDGTRKDPVQR